MELYHNQVTRGQGSFSLRSFHRSWGILMIQGNINAPCAVLDFPTREAFAKELTAHHYDIVGISSIIVNVGKAREMCRMVRELSPGTTIIMGGHITAIPGVEQMLDADHIVKGDGIAWMREYLGEEVDAPIRHPDFSSAFDLRVLGVKIPVAADTTSATIISSVGCPMGCNFCTTSAFFGGKGKILNFYETGEELFGLMEHAEKTRGKHSFFIMDENFLLQKRRVMELLALMKAAGKSWTFNIFSSANAIAKYTYEELAEIGIATIWLGLESPRSNYSKLNGADTLKLTRELREHGIVLLGSTIIGLEHHTPENVYEEIEHAIAHETDLHQFMLYTPVPGTPLYFEMAGTGTAAGCGSGGHTRSARVQFRTRGDLTRAIHTSAGVGIPARFRTKWPEFVPHLPDHVCGIYAVQESPGSTHPRALAARVPHAAPCLGRVLVGDGAPAERVEPRSGGEDSRAAQGDGAGVRLDRRCRGQAAGPGALVDQPARGTAPGCRAVLRAHSDY